MKDVVVPIVVALIAGAMSGGLVPIVKAFRERGRERSDIAREWVTDFKKEAKEARAELAAVRTEAVALADELHRLRLAILAPEVTIDGLRELVRRGTGGAPNGRR